MYVEYWVADEGHADSAWLPCICATRPIDFQKYDRQHINGEVLSDDCGFRWREW